MKIFAALLSLSAFFGAEAHSRWKCPKARDWNDQNGKHITFDNTGNKNGPCGPFNGQWGMGGNFTLTPNSWQTLTWEESVFHTGAPFRISILDENEVDRVTLLDHIPHNEAAKPVPYIEATYVPYSITVWIPDVLCQVCSLRVLMFMTDKTVNCDQELCTYYADDSACSGHTDSEPACSGAPNNTPCLRENTCFSNYHSCFDVSIYGSVPIAQANFTQPNIWPFANQTQFVYGDEPGPWTDGWLQHVPSEFTTEQGQKMC